MHLKPLHIISFDNPYPPKYGGTIEVYYKIKALSELGYTIHLHCFILKETQVSEELKAITAEVYFYKYSYNLFNLLSKLPFSVVSRNSTALLTNIKKVKAPILFESLKTTLLVKKGQLKEYTKILRLHNVEQDYFKGIASSEKDPIKKLLYRLEGIKFKKYESIISEFDDVLTLSHFEHEHVSELFGNSHYIPVFHGNNKVKQLSETGGYALYHGDLKTPDNRLAAAAIIAIFKEIKDYSLIIASSSNEAYIKRLAGDASNIKFIKLQGFSHLKELLNQAHINIVWSLQRSGTKLKLINALFHSRHCIINCNIIDDAAVAGLCERAETEEQLVEAVNRLKLSPFNGAKQRADVLEYYLNDLHNATLIDKLISENDE